MLPNFEFPEIKQDHVIEFVIHLEETMEKKSRGEISAEKTNTQKL